ncbi:uncharacterized protein LOC129762029 [Toxorhynchites rutilus septentrionalis]|uniref:uncharacterized protein LOC129762029 n=1 Tax=Toxorhynchites rutilus septentrionalis TaxID=329112 RepID=UPI0024797812|nr:uncharacterized protein LOC129762029 [Toxorhynchites rutilus septentrionalis]
MLKALFLLTCYIWFASGATQCSVDLQKNFNKRSPLLLEQKGSTYPLQIPDGSKFQWRVGSGVLIGCSDASNTIHKVRDHSARISCERNQEFTLRNKKYQFSQLDCVAPVTSSIQSQNISCAGGLGTLFNIGFEVKGLPFVKYFQSCYNVQDASAIYTEHEIFGRSIDLAQRSGDHSFKTGGLASKVRFSEVYLVASQKDRLEKLLGSETEAKKYMSSTFLAKGHLTPDRDALLDTWAAATYFYINAAPEWQVVNTGNWKRVENAARKRAETLADTIIVFTGVYDVLQLPDVNRTMVPITLTDKSEIAVPKWFWKILHHTKSDSAIAFVTLNNPFASTKEYLCKNICNMHGWDQQEFGDLSRGLTYCCTVKELRSVIQSIPVSADAKNVLKFG